MESSWRPGAARAIQGIASGASGGAGRSGRPAPRRSAATAAPPSAALKLSLSAQTTTATATTTTDALYRLLTWLSPAYPVGAYTYSHGLETAAEEGAGDAAGWAAAAVPSPLRIAAEDATAPFNIVRRSN